jgi:hypothetical protein
LNRVRCLSHELKLMMHDGLATWLVGLGSVPSLPGWKWNCAWVTGPTAPGVLTLGLGRSWPWEKRRGAVARPECGAAAMQNSVIFRSLISSGTMCVSIRNTDLLSRQHAGPAHSPRSSLVFVLTFYFRSKISSPSPCVTLSTTTACHSDSHCFTSLKPNAAPASVHVIEREPGSNRVEYRHQCEIHT